ncbi:MULTISPECIES: DUF4245 domain-containing protein [Streptomyces]|jgi:hypothetical protein|uniref:DUF4245 domain-containing protein n=2 Tax=Streptomyces TaxID=1883 RepID=A0A514JPJ8_9ACTN|nr:MULTISPECIES: DUF4245 domain-containing protein [Streptomyces]MBA8946917.1 hypothetical protein [Streptomyces calvus]MBA8974520.1 hypothetical protein [Streptomyces calvus]MYS32428.1 DUF4245 family protein [Streptomyces sp. SID7804]QDI69257.1 hypothetical protein CD934_11500 [Streptomyces calvus]GGP72785.1 hypothetical protein GCM10010247_52730 [Streptomyces calvus]
MQKTARDMILSLALIVLAAGVVWLFIPHEDGEPPVQRVDYRVDLLTARRAASYPVAAPEGLPEAWKPTSVRFRGEDADAWHLGFHAPDGQYVAVEQSAGKRGPFIEDVTQGAERTDATQRIGDETWTRYEGDHYDALVLEGTEGSTTVVTGTASFGQLTTMAQALRTE